MELDDTAKFRSGGKWGADLEFPLPFGRTLTGAEEYISGLDEATGASLKFTVLNPKGRVWLMVAGGGASVIYTDTVADLGFAQVRGAPCFGSEGGRGGREGGGRAGGTSVAVCHTPRTSHVPAAWSAGPPLVA